MKGREMAKSEKLKIEYRAPASLVPYARNARTHSEAQIAQIAGSIAEFGFTNPILIYENGVIIAGHGRLAAAQKLGLDKVPCITLAGLTDTQRRALILADNRLAENAGWDTEMLRVELEELTDAGADLDAIGFDDDALDILLSGDEDEKEHGDPEKYTKKIDAPQYEPTGKHVDILADCCNVERYEQLLKEIDASRCGDDVKKFMRYAATRFIGFTYKNIAEFYANDADKETQYLFEKLALVIVNFDDALKNGFVKISERLQEALGERRAEE